MLQLLDGDVTDADQSLGIADVMKVEVAMETATIPNLEFVEQQVAALDLQPTQ
jgi:urease alpha subunit